MVVVLGGIVVVVASVVVVEGGMVVVVEETVVVVVGAVVVVLLELVVGWVVELDVVGAVVGVVEVTLELVVGAVVVVVVGGGRVTRGVLATVVVVTAKGPPMVVVVSPAARVVVVPSTNTERTSVCPSPELGGIAPTFEESAEDMPVNQFTPIMTAKARPPARATRIRPEIMRPTRTLSRRENEDLAGPDSARRSAICLARSSGVSRSLPLGPEVGGGNRGPFSPSAP